MKGFSVLGFGGRNGRRRSLGKMHVYDKCVFVREFTNRSNWIPRERVLRTRQASRQNPDPQSVNDRDVNVSPVQTKKRRPPHSRDRNSLASKRCVGSSIAIRRSGHFGSTQFPTTAQMPGELMFAMLSRSHLPDARRVNDNDALAVALLFRGREGYIQMILDLEGILSFLSFSLFGFYNLVSDPLITTNFD